MPRGRRPRQQRVQGSAWAQYQTGGTISPVRTYKTAGANITTGGGAVEGISDVPQKQDAQGPLMHQPAALSQFLSGQVTATNPPTPVNILPTPSELALCINRTDGTMGLVPIGDLRVDLGAAPRTRQRRAARR